MEFKFDFKFTENAENDLDEILNYISIDLDNPIAAKDFYNELDKAIARPRQFPFSGAPVSNPYVKTPGVRKLYVKNYTVFYYPDESINTITILRIIYSHRNIEEILHSI